MVRLVGRVEGNVGKCKTVILAVDYIVLANVNFVVEEDKVVWGIDGFRDSVAVIQMAFVFVLGRGEVTAMFNGFQGLISFAVVVHGEMAEVRPVGDVTFALSHVASDSVSWGPQHGGFWGFGLR